MLRRSGSLCSSAASVLPFRVHCMPPPSWKAHMRKGVEWEERVPIGTAQIQCPN